jgi:ferredoxin-NADP reductase
VVVRGQRLDQLDAHAGQFFRRRFLGAGLARTSTPYSLSAPPRRDRMRITVKALGDHSAAAGLLRPGTRVWAEGPYGSLTANRRTVHKCLLIAGGAGRHHPAEGAVGDAARRSRPALPGTLGRMYEALRTAGVPDRRIHHESFEL